MLVELTAEQIEFVRHTLQSKICYDSNKKWEYECNGNTNCVKWKEKEIETCETIIKQLKDVK